MIILVRGSVYPPVVGCLVKQPYGCHYISAKMILLSLLIRLKLPTENPAISCND